MSKAETTVAPAAKPELTQAQVVHAEPTKGGSYVRDTASGQLLPAAPKPVAQQPQE